MSEPIMEDLLPIPPHGWSCFHCGEEFAPTYIGHRDARRHFGGDESMGAGCILKLNSEDQTILVPLRKREADLHAERAKVAVLEQAVAELRARASRAEESLAYNREKVASLTTTNAKAAQRIADLEARERAYLAAGKTMVSFRSLAMPYFPREKMAVDIFTGQPDALESWMAREE